MLIPEVNLGQLAMLIRARFLIDAISYNRVRGKPFRISEIHAEAERILGVGDGPVPAPGSDHSPNSTAGVD